MFIIIWVPIKWLVQVATLLEIIMHLAIQVNHAVVFNGYLSTRGHLAGLRNKFQQRHTKTFASGALVTS